MLLVFVSVSKYVLRITVTHRALVVYRGILHLVVCLKGLLQLVVCLKGLLQLVVCLKGLLHLVVCLKFKMQQWCSCFINFLATLITTASKSARPHSHISIVTYVKVDHIFTNGHVYTPKTLKVCADTILLIDRKNAHTINAPALYSTLKNRSLYIING